MRKTMKITNKGFWLMIALIAVLCSMGAVQGQWTSTLGIHHNLFTGNMNLVYGEEKAFLIAVVDSQGREVQSLGKVDYKFADKTKKTVELNIADPADWLEEIINNPNHMLMIQYYIEPESDSSIERIVPEKADISQPSREKVVFSESDLQLSIGHTSYDLAELPEAIQHAMKTVDLEWNVYREIEQDESAQGRNEDAPILATVYLTLTDSSRRALDNAESGVILLDESTDEVTAAEVEAFFSVGDGSTLSFVIHSKYTFTLDLALQQA